MGGFLVVLIRRLFFFLAIAWCAFSQQSAFQQVFNNVSVPGPSAIVRNIGQGSHIVLVVASAATGTGTACAMSATPIFIHLEFSFNGTLWVPFGAPTEFLLQGALGLPQVNVLLGAGVYPQVRLNLVSFDQTNCVISAWYSGAQAGSGLTQVSGPAASNSFTGTVRNSSVNPLPLGVVTTGNVLTPAFVCGGGPQIGGPSFGSAPVGTTEVLAPANTAPPTQNVICGFVITMAAAGTVQFVTGTAPGCTPGTQPLTPAWNLAAGTPFVAYATFGTALFSVPQPPGTLCLVVTGGAAQYFISTAILG